MLSNGNVLFTRMQYVAEVTPDKKVVWRYDVPPGREIHASQPIGLRRVAGRHFFHRRDTDWAGRQILRIEHGAINCGGCSIT